MRLLTFLLVVCLTGQAVAWTPTHKVETDRGQLYLRPVDEHSVLFEFRPGELAPLVSVENSPLWDPEFIDRQILGGELKTLKVGEGLEFGDSSKLYSFVDPVSGRLSLEIRHTDPGSTTSNRIVLEVSGHSGYFSRELSIRAPHVEHLYGLGEQFPQRYLGETKVDWKGRLRHAGYAPDSYLEDPIGVYGNSLTPLAGGNLANAMFPVLYMADEEGSDALLFLDNATDSRWDFQRKPWEVKLRHGEFSGALTWGAESEELRRRYLTWTGRPPVPPRKAFGLWVSEYGFENWDELEEKASSLQENDFPVDGFVLDLQWFGGITEGSPDSNMGRLQFDLKNFPNPAAKIAELASRGLGVIVIEESYISRNLPEFEQLAQRGFLVEAPDKKGSPHIINRNPWWGIGGMIDYLDPEAGAFWHQEKRQPLSELGVMGHWTDLGEPEVFRREVKRSRGKTKYETPLYHGGKTQLEANNYFGFSWARSIFEGYGSDTHLAGPRPFILARTGTSGIQRFGASLWSGDIGANWESLRSHYVSQSHMSYSGIDYYGSDVGGFFREAFDGGREDFDELYSRWFSAACLTDIPLRPHTMNLGNRYETSPDRVGDKASNLWNLKLRYRLIPYLYSSAYEAWRKGDPVIGPASLATATEAELSESGTIKWVGKSLLAYLVLYPGVGEMDCLLPEGEWYDFYTGRPVEEREVTVATRDAQGRYRTPLFTKGGSVIPVGSERESRARPELLEFLLFPGSEPGSATVYYDDGSTEAYRGGAFATTTVGVSPFREGYGQIVVGPAAGEYAVPAYRTVKIHLAAERRNLQALLGETPLEVEQKGGFHVITLPQVSSGDRLEINIR